MQCQKKDNLRTLKGNILLISNIIFSLKKLVFISRTENLVCLEYLICSTFFKQSEITLSKKIQLLKSCNIYALKLL